MTYKESARKLNELRRANEVIFRMAVSHLMDCGIRHLTEENIKETCDAIMQEDDSKAFMTNEFKCELIRIAGELAKIDHIHLLVYISREVYYDVGDTKVSYQRALELVEDCMTWMSYEWSNAEACRNFTEIGFTEDEFIEFGYRDLLTGDDEQL